MSENTKYIRLPEVLELVPASRSAIYGWIKAQKFPSQVRLGDRLVAWNRDAIMTWLEQRAVANGHP